ncbi:Gfo/Idh/MocA family protein [Niastella sp. OAS944]|uniref:Gfo/Idh/MocA family protein n=1 Tax=Niastella sp. OAS944 TaxID=2664089 RepID=UPI003471A7EE|nr:hypothetical protein [Chitinophagaceae bacterium OAS944]
MNPKPTTTARRQFIKNAAILVPTITLFPSWLTASNGSRLRIALIGAGAWGQQYLQAALQHKEIYVSAICEHDAAAIQQIKQIFNKAGIALPAFYNEGSADYKKLLARTDVDAVIIATPWHIHYEIAKAALLAGKHVACGPIMGSTIEEHWDIVNTSKQTGKQYVTLDEQSYRRDLMAITCMITEGKLGELKTIHAGAGYSPLQAEQGATPYPVYPATATANLLGISSANRYTSMRIQQHQQDCVITKVNPKTKTSYQFVTSGLASTICLETSNGQSVLLQSNFNTEQHISTGFWLQATGGSWKDIWEWVNVTGGNAVRLDLGDNHPYLINSLAQYKQAPGQENVALMLNDFVKTVQQPATGHPPVCVAATNSVIGTLATMSARQHGTTIQFPNFYS